MKYKYYKNQRYERRIIEHNFQKFWTTLLALKIFS